MQKIKFFNVNLWTFNDKNLQKSQYLKLLKIKYIYIKKVSMHFINKIFI